MIIQPSTELSVVKVTAPSWAVKCRCCPDCHLYSCWAPLAFQIVLLNSRRSLTQTTKNTPCWGTYRLCSNQDLYFQA